MRLLPCQRLRLSARRAAGLALIALIALIAASIAGPAAALERGPARAATGAEPAASATTATGAARVIVKYRADASVVRALSASSPSGAEPPPQHAAVFAARLGIPLEDGAPVGERSQLVRASGIGAAELAARLAAQSDVEYAVVDQRVRVRRVPNDALFPAGQATTPVTGQWSLRTAGIDGEVASINAEAAWDISTGTPGVVVAVVDTGITAHPDLAGKVLPGYDFVNDATTAGDGDGRDADPSDPGDGITTSQIPTVSNCDSSDVGTSSWHGTQTAGLVGAATNNATGMASIGWNVMLLPLRALGRCGGSESDVIAAIRWAAGLGVSGVPANPNKARVINLSLGGPSGVACDAAYQDAISAAIAAGAVVVAAGGNDGLALGAPANCAGVIAVAGVRHIGTKVGYSDLGANVTIAAPAGNCVNATGTCLYPLLTTTNNGAYAVGAAAYSDGDTRPSLGTSFSAPLVSGTVALMLSSNPALTPARVTSAIQATARPFPTSGAPPLQSANGSLVPVAACVAPSSVPQGVECYCSTLTCGAGLLDAGAAVRSVAALTANVVASSTTPVTGAAVTLDGSTSNAAAGRTVVAYQWTITAGADLASLSGSTTDPKATLVASGVGTVAVALTVTDSAGQTGTGSTAVTIASAPSLPVSESGGSGGGGGVSAGWLLGLVAAVVALRIVRLRSPAR